MPLLQVQTRGLLSNGRELHPGMGRAVMCGTNHPSRQRLSALSADRIADGFIGTLTEKFWVAKSALKRSARTIISQNRGNHMKSKGGFIGMSKSAKILIAFAVGQITQLVLHGMVVSLNMWDNKRVLFCAAFGFVILFAAIAGVVIARQQDTKLEKDFKEKKSYLDWAAIPEDDVEVVNPFANKK